MKKRFDTKPWWMKYQLKEDKMQETTKKPGKYAWIATVVVLIFLGLMLLTGGDNGYVSGQGITVRARTDQAEVMSIYDPIPTSMPDLLSIEIHVFVPAKNWEPISTPEAPQQSLTVIHQRDLVGELR